jgi:cytochrome c oxidase subunit II
MTGDCSVNKTKPLLTALAMLALGMSAAQAEYALNMPAGVTQISREVYDLHMTVIWICVGIGVVVFSAMFYSIYHHRKSKGAVAAQFHESTKVEIVWTVIPFIILISMAIPATKAMIDMDDTSNADLSIKVTGYQWKWRYEYLDEGIDFMSNLDPMSNAARQKGSTIKPERVPNYLREVDNPLVVPVNKKIRFLFTAADVIHSWWVPELGWKKDTIPGFITEAWTKIEKPGIYRGQCAELCGKDHGFMPIVVVAKTEEEYAQWVAEQKGEAAAKVEAAGKTWTQDDLIARGEQVYNSSCASCHQANGEGVPGTFPAIAGSPIATGPIERHIEVVMKGGGTMMPPFADTLDAVDLAAVISFQRNAFENDMDDSVQPSDIQSRLASGQ